MLTFSICVKYNLPLPLLRFYPLCSCLHYALHAIIYWDIYTHTHTTTTVQHYCIDYARQYSLQPGCWTIMCAHSRSYEYFAESVNNGKHFIAAQCNSLSSLRNGRCTKRFVEMGLNTPHTVRGNFYLETNSKPPYGRSFKPYNSLLQQNQLVLLE